MIDLYGMQWEEASWILSGIDSICRKQIIFLVMQCERTRLECW